MDIEALMDRLLVNCIDEWELETVFSDALSDMDEASRAQIAPRMTERAKMLLAQRDIDLEPSGIPAYVARKLAEIREDNMNFDDLSDFDDYPDDDVVAMPIRELIASLIDLEVQSHYLTERFCEEFRGQNVTGRQDMVEMFADAVRDSPAARNLPKYTPSAELAEFADMLTSFVKGDCPLPPPTNNLDF